MQQFAAELSPLEVHARCRFVQNQDLRFLKQGGGKQDPLDLPAGKRPERTVRQLLTFHLPEHLHDPGFLFFGCSEKDRHFLDPGKKKILHGHGHIPVKLQFLRHKTEPDAAAGSAIHERDRSRVRFLSQQRQRQTGLARPVGTDDGGGCALRNVGVHILQNQCIAQLYIDIFKGDCVTHCAASRSFAMFCSIVFSR